MTIQKGVPWGEEVPRPPDLRVATDDAELARLLADGSGAPTAVASGDMFRTIGARPIGDRAELLAFPVDLVRVELDRGERVVAISHVVARLPTSAGGALRGPLLAVMNAEWIGTYDVAPRGHPNDGRVETFLASNELTVRERLAVRTRLANASHLPHPRIAVRSVRSAEWTFDRPMEVRVDGRSIGRSRLVRIDVDPDAAFLYA